uniref:transposase n=1 Tax=Nocardia macrotermitis TaxID=2585198 RepID=UPI003872FD73
MFPRWDTETVYRSSVDRRKTTSGSQDIVVHLLRASFRYAARQDWDAIAKALKPVYTAPTESAALERFCEFTDTWGGKYPAIVRPTAWPRFPTIPIAGRSSDCRVLLRVTSLLLGGQLYRDSFALPRGPQVFNQRYRAESTGCVCEVALWRNDFGVVRDGRGRALVSRAEIGAAGEGRGGDSWRVCRVSGLLAGVGV